MFSFSVNTQLFWCPIQSPILLLLCPFYDNKSSPSNAYQGFYTFVFCRFHSCWVNHLAPFQRIPDPTPHALGPLIWTLLPMFPTAPEISLCPHRMFSSCLTTWSLQPWTSDSVWSQMDHARLRIVSSPKSINTFIYPWLRTSGTFIWLNIILTRFRNSRD